ncbi:glycoside hydrolase family 5 protein [Polychaeton citri CBS 116435]|uniref:glucan 1,3-beta-glucosidase n=1 Tax=Polychaeton citri CBS 116435 TaxID=1314669 RepID=A0A9P4UNN5_9PEZI|nr:glycoside hydrolase family 5 protein [Polychaeton citri CBS 116435]
MPSSSRPGHDSPSNRDSPARRQRRRRTHRREDSNSELLGRVRDENDESYGYGDGPSSPSKRRPREHRRSSHQQHERRRRSSRQPDSEYSKSTSNALSANQLAHLDKLNRKAGWSEYDNIQRRPADEEEEETYAEYDEDFERERREREAAREKRRQEHRERKRKRREEERLAEKAAALAEMNGMAYEQPKSRRQNGERVVSGQRLERGGGAYSEYTSEKESYRHDARRRDGSSDGSYDEFAEAQRKKRKKWILIAVGVLVLLLVIIIPVAVVVSGKKSSGGGGGDGAAPNASSTAPANGNLDGISEDDIPAWAKGTYYDPFTWYDTDDFNVTVTNETVGGLPIMGLNNTWDDSACANDKVPCLKDEWKYDGSMKIHGVNIGGWLSIEPWITPSFFSGFDSSQGVVDEYTLSQTLGPHKAAAQIEQHYSSFVSESTFQEIQAAGFDHVRIPFSYWAVTTYEGDPYVAKISWRYLIRGLEWARKYGLRINLDLHGAPGSQNGWNHSGRQGPIGWLNGTDGQVNADRTLEVHDQLSKFFTQPRYKNLVTMYSLVNEPRMVELDADRVMNWTSSATTLVQKNNFTGVVVFGDGFMGLDKWQGQLQNLDNLLLDVHQYVIFNVEQIVLNHHDKINFACGGWTQQSRRSMEKSTGFGPTMCGEWSQADTDCAENLNNVGVGSRWEGTLNYARAPGLSSGGGVGGTSDGSVLTPTCPTANNPKCDCRPANADASQYSDEYKKWLLMFAEAQMYSFEQGWGWFYWTWQTESSTQWSYKAGIANGILPQKAYERDFNCDSTIPMFNDSGLPEFY